MNNQFLYEKLEIIKEFNNEKHIPDIIELGLSRNIKLRDYQKDAFLNFITYFENQKLSNNKQIHALFHMATGSGKTVIMAGLILYLYEKGYRNFIFFVNQINILEKTRDNFLNNSSTKYLFNDKLEFKGQKIKINSVNNFQGIILDDNSINICFTTTQKLHIDLSDPKENVLTYNDFEDKKIVFISDESHHINSLTKKSNKEEIEANNSWEYSVMNAFYSNKDSILLEFTATADLKDQNVLNKYRDKIIFNYPLKDFRESGYTKDFQNLSSLTTYWDRALIAIIISEYRRYLFSELNLNIKPVILFKSQKINESELFYKEFFEHIKNLSINEIENLYNTNIDILKQALDYFYDKSKSYELLILSIKNNFIEEQSLIINGSSDSSKEKQLLVNSLEDKNNLIRIIFAVDMLNEGWDVLNLFDIVRLYDTRQGSGKVNKIGSYTIKEAQLIGRGARYCPFIYGDEELEYKRKFDSDLNNKYRLLETMFFHSWNDSSYIWELRQALIASGLEPETRIKIDYKVKESFKQTQLYKNGYIFSNKRGLKKTNNDQIENRLKNKIYKYTIKSVDGYINNLFDTNIAKNNTRVLTKYFLIKDIDYHIVLGASEFFNELNFWFLKTKFPKLKTLKEFLTSENFVANIKIEFNYFKNQTIKGKDLFESLKIVFADIANYIGSIKPYYIGTKRFYAYPIKNVIKDKSIYLNLIHENGGRGTSQINCHDEKYKLDLNQENWYVYNDNFGTSEEKMFIKYFKNEIAPKLNSKKLEYYIIRNERIPELAIYSFLDGSRFEPDFLLFIKKKGVDNTSTNYQVFVEPKGEMLLEIDKWKENFLLEINDEFQTEVFLANDYKILGLPFYNNKYDKIEIFSKAINDLIKKI
ncbi:MAG: DEAD/DEAH box helicase family protein [Ureaplasma parvum]|uniref:Type III restriction endonuclease subunit R n=1 Tax=Ureaplasma parvum TaxID=134821 RepID=A0AAC9T053_UREPR|nr:DEAD/DEAH box helicase family protein [Ureaplasma parvum]ASD24549.1 type III restriction endonuclease subunit R [Ureaplasma parvum]ASD25172.1 type III restriction endonuclease subunit R [Ureaplasma parvum]ASD28897.1 type III restriction endonuclease subunit R [Ureaplasma parvum]ASD29421.1 type III restriction endonuclease subunit R [Ureaplasma parvum]ASD29814.1 type III restriction endonuclease subunit R [Ureaplasma parvum]